MSLRLLFPRVCASALVVCVMTVGCMSVPVRVARGLSRVHGLLSTVGRTRGSRESRSSEELRAPLASEAAGGGFTPHDHRGHTTGPGDDVGRRAAGTGVRESARARASTPVVLRI